ncbi:MAG: WXG100 family type VII secretion target, partial [Anaerolineales bacterium]|nr:WXG100 family type VII secretion target [Anaerolineales bacterium]
MGQATIVQANYEKLEAIAQKFGDQEQLTAHLRDRIAQQVDALRGGAWVGAGAESLLQEMDSEVLPACQRLSAALGE